MDEINMKILNVLQMNSRITYKEISKIVKISGVAVGNRIKNMNNIIKSFTILVNQKEYGKNITAIFDITCETGKSQEIAKKIASIDDVMEVYTTLGKHDIVAKARTKNLESLKGIVEKEFFKIKGINEIRTSIVFDCIKENVSLIM
jgi:DNA-binding Lrp family transcriptional regulator|tara:strand:- start:379 stop:816 length:438 start_codon:yes stop_codon:yes gene_type:complete